MCKGPGAGGSGTRNKKEAQGAWRVKVTGRDVKMGSRSPQRPDHRARGQWRGFDFNSTGKGRPQEGFKQGNDMFIFEFYGVFPPARAFSYPYRHVRDHYYREFYATLCSTPCLALYEAGAP